MGNPKGEALPTSLQSIQLAQTEAQHGTFFLSLRAVRPWVCVPLTLLNSSALRSLSPPVLCSSVPHLSPSRVN